MLNLFSAICMFCNRACEHGNLDLRHYIIAALYYYINAYASALDGFCLSHDGADYFVLVETLKRHGRLVQTHNRDCNRLPCPSVKRHLELH